MRKAILNRLGLIRTPGERPDILTFGLVNEEDVQVDGGKVIVPINAPEGYEGDLDAVKTLIEDQLSSMKDIERLVVTIGGGGGGGGDDKASAAPQGGVTVEEIVDEPRLPPKLKARPTEAPGKDMRPMSAAIPGIKNIVAVASGKGGVGKSTTSANLALALHALGLKVGLLDADIYGPSMPRLMGVTERPTIDAENRVRPIEKYGIKIMSMGFLMEEESPVIWRGPMVVTALMQMTREIDWGELDVLVLDMPPGTGDAQLTLAQQVPLQGAVIVSTPQDLALIDARKGLKMFKNVDVPILGVVENMSTFICPHCGETSDIFGHGGAEADARRLGVPFLGAIPLHMSIRETSDAGAPIVTSQPDGPHARHYRDIALRIATVLFPEDDAD